MKSAIRRVLGTTFALAATWSGCSASIGPDGSAETAGAGASAASGDPAGAGGTGSGAGSGSGATASCTDITDPDSGLLDSGAEAVPEDLGPPAEPVLGQSVKSGAWSDP